MIARTGTVLNSQWDIGGEFLVHFDDDAECHSFRVNKKWDLYQTIPPPPVPKWTPPLSVKDAADLDQVVVRFSNSGFQHNWRMASIPVILSFIHALWGMRLPLEGL